MNILRRTTVLSSKLVKNARQTSTKLYEPDYLEVFVSHNLFLSPAILTILQTMKPKIPLYDILNIQMRGYDYAILESYQKLVHRIATNMDINVDDAWATPAQHLQIVTYKPNTEIVDSKYSLKNYERTVQVTDISGPQV